MGSQTDILKKYRIHLYDFEDMLRPRGSMQKESLSFDILERLKSVFESWTNKEYYDSKSESEIEEAIIKNLKEEVEIAIGEFKRQRI